MTNFIVTLSDYLIKTVNIKAQEKQISPNEIVILALDDYFADDSQDDPTTEEIIAIVEKAIEDANAGRVHSIDEVIASLETPTTYLNDNTVHKTKFTAQLSPELIDLIYTKVDEEGFSVDFIFRATLSMYFDDN